MVPVREVAAPPRRPMPGRGRGRPRTSPEMAAVEPISPALPPPSQRFERPPIDYSALEEAMAQLEGTLRRARSQL
jgi:hypothetical protein